ncbi:MULTISPECIES: DUF5606 domain-containing protein [Duncaniella]|mgnify:FL=1|jgi:hypothetical protein|uniref:Uncharacterized protein n=1 Tax=Duncaniella muris TaxID=2094150 RepID=A0A2V1ILG5_9BACT|nr:MULTISPECIES: DUF5606 domain-containing protein [Duncaniella]NBH93634.1 hypothetical protein [Muribaculaceae bacterium S4]NBI21946.1 hypothetical protein [Muribaculaceae bacterium Z1]ROS88403.1 hypothetical protein EEL34_08415 [Muribaculaceae bacterium Isolate-039 (Harlan)]ROS97806.1 hypothetical protein EEL37_05650 [Muribaculaceae bacterium Isolate-077 (Janvier)]ROS99294.1 hypothetical protein EEL40_03610 [Muribaculaceae bacterium Isolate-083 (Janvier)]ROT02140.1 hypothetical protein EEL4
MLKNILSISGRPGLFRLSNRGKNMLIVESIADGKRTPAYARDKVISLGDISIYTDEGDVPLWEVLESVKVKSNGEQVDIKSIGNDAAVREYFAGILPNFDREKVYTSDIRKLLTWYNQLLAGGITEFKPEEASEENAEPEA